MVIIDEMKEMKYEGTTSHYVKTDVSLILK